jgi:hypothetical protein
MKWLVTVPAGINIKRVRAKLLALGCSADEYQEPIPLDNSELVIEVEGPRDLPKRTAGEHDIVKVSPSSDLTLY